MATVEETAEEKKTREEAQARRQRILEGATSRMDVVEGVQKPKASEGASSKMAAMRRRRFKKKTETTEPEAPTTKENETPQAVVEPTPDVQQHQEDIVDDTATAATTATKKKYMGVAKMRRMKLKEKQQQEDSATEQVEAAVVSKRPRKIAPRFPILMHLVVVLLLFVAGLDIGLQQAAIDYQDYNGKQNSVLSVHTELAPRQLGGISFLVSKLSNDHDFVRGGEATTAKLAREEPPLVASTDDSDEFEVSDVEKEIVMDPLFGVDLDLLTAGPGPIMWAARQAVKVHRLLLRIFYYGPIQFSQWLLSCTINPPIFAVMAVILRQLVGNVILGAKLQELKEDEEQQKDIMSMVKSFVTKFVFSAFPTAVSLYDAWVHLRADMYVVLCGFFVGLAVSHTPNIQDGSLLAGLLTKSTTGTSDEL